MDLTIIAAISVLLAQGTPPAAPPPPGFQVAPAETVAPPKNPAEEPSLFGGGGKDDLKIPLSKEKAASPAAPAAPPPAGVGGLYEGGNSPPVAPPDDKALPRGPAAPPSAAPPSAAESAPAVPVKRSTSAELIRAMATPPASGVLAGRPLSLLEALSATRDRARTFEMIARYWRLNAAILEYRAALEAAEALRQVAAKRSGPDVETLRMAKNIALGSLRDAERSALRAQYELAEAAGMTSGAGLPLPSDAPFVETYNTVFANLQAVRSLPPRARLLDRTITLRRPAVEAHLKAYQAADDAVQAVLEAYPQGEVGVVALIASVQHRAARLRTLAASVEQYNRDIAEYALTAVAASQQMPTPAAIVRMLIAAPADASRQGAGWGPAAPAPLAGPTTVPVFADPQVMQAGFNVPLQDASAAPVFPMQGQVQEPEPTLAPPRPTTSGAPPATSDPTNGEVPPGVKTAPRYEPGKLPWRNSSSTPSASEAPAAAGVDASALSAGLQPLPRRPGLQPPPQMSGTSSEPEATSALPNSSSAIPYTTRRENADGPDLPLYAVLATAKPAERARDLSLALHVQVALEGTPGRPIDLKQYLIAVPQTDRRLAVTAYWDASRRLAEYLYWTRHAALLRQLGTVVMEQRNQLGGKEAGVRVEAARTAAEADRLDAAVELAAARFELTRRAGQPLASEWLLPLTSPLATPYALQLEQQPPAVAKSPAVQRLAASIDALTKAMQDSAAAVVIADASRAAAVGAYRQESRALDEALASLQYQAMETLAFLRTEHAFNCDIAEYVMIVVPSIAPEVLVQALVGR